MFTTDKCVRTVNVHDRRATSLLLQRLTTEVVTFRKHERYFYIRMSVELCVLFANKEN